MVFSSPVRHTPARGSEFSSFGFLHPVTYLVSSQHVNVGCSAILSLDPVPLIAVTSQRDSFCMSATNCRMRSATMIGVVFGLLG